MSRIEERHVQTIAKWLLRISGAVVCCSFFAIFLPLSWMETIHQSLGLGKIPDRPIFEYLARSLSAMYLAHGIMTLAISLDVARYWPLVGVCGVINVGLGLVFLVTDLIAPMPWFWTVGEGPPIILFGGALLILWRAGRRAPATRDA